MILIKLRYKKHGYGVKMTVLEADYGTKNTLEAPPFCFSRTYHDVGLSWDESFGDMKLLEFAGAVAKLNRRKNVVDTRYADEGVIV